MLESSLPVRDRSLRLCWPTRRGAGLHRGGLSLQREYTFLQECDLSVRSDRATIYPYGIGTGRPGTPSLNRPRASWRRGAHAVEVLSTGNGRDSFDSPYCRRRWLGRSFRPGRTACCNRCWQRDPVQPSERSPNTESYSSRTRPRSIPMPPKQNGRRAVPGPKRRVQPAGLLHRHRLRWRTESATRYEHLGSSSLIVGNRGGLVHSQKPYDYPIRPHDMRSFGDRHRSTRSV